MARRFLKFVGPMRTLSQRGFKFEKDKIYAVDNEERALDMIESGRFKEVRDPTKKKDERRPERRHGGVRIQRNRERDSTNDAPERGDLSRSDLLNVDDEEGEDGHEVDDDNPRVVGSDDGTDPNQPKLPAQAFTSKGGAVKWAKDNLDIDLDKTRSLAELNRVIASEYGKRYAPPKSDDEDDADTKDENTTVDAIVVA